MTVELTDIGVLSLLALVFSLVLGGQVVDGGFTVSANMTLAEPVRVYATPIIFVRIDNGPLQKHLWGAGVTLGSTIVYIGPEYGIGYFRDLKHYELGHVSGWNHYGLTYLLQVFMELCTYDPRAPWAQHCLNHYRTPLLLTPRTGAIRFTL